jgi:hypothetical protein
VSGAGGRPGSGWTAEELRRIGQAHELTIEPARPDGGFRAAVPIWVVRAGDLLFVRSWHGRGAAWFRHATATGRARIRAGGVERVVTLTEADPSAQEQVDAAFFDKYGRNRYVEEMVAPDAVAASLRLDPEG